MYDNGLSVLDDLIRLVEKSSSKDEFVLNAILDQHQDFFEDEFKDMLFALGEKHHLLRGKLLKQYRTIYSNLSTINDYLSD